MSGGSLDYVCYRVDEAADTIEARARTSLHQAFADHVRKVGVALHDIEWLFSGDYGDGQEEAAIRAVLDSRAELDTTAKRAAVAAQALADALNAYNENVALVPVEGGGSRG
jgi:hypothetical protein